MVFLENNIKKLTEASTVREILLLLNTYWDHNNYTLLKMLVDTYGSKGLQREMDSYVSDIQRFWHATKVDDYIKFCKQNNYRFKPWPATEAPLNFAQLKCVIDKPVTECTLYDVERLRCQFSQHLKMQDFALVLSEIGEGSLVVQWLMAPVFIEHSKSILFEFESDKFIEEMNIKRVFMDIYPQVHTLIFMVQLGHT